MWSIIYYGFLYDFIYKRYQYKISPLLLFLILFLELVSIINSDLLLFITLQILLFQSICDLINQDVYTFVNYSLIPIGLYVNWPTLDNMLPLFLFIGILYLLARLSNGIGLGDIQLLFCLGFVLNLAQLLEVILLSCVLNIFYAYLHPKKSYCFVPFISLSFFIIYLIK